MKQFFHLLIFLAAINSAVATVQEDIAFNLKVRRAGAELFRNAHAADVHAYLLANLRTPPDQTSKTIEIAQTLIEISGQFFNERKLSLAKQAASEAFTLTVPLLQVSAPPLRCADLCASLGQLCENVFYDVDTAKGYYEAALAIRPSQPLAADRLKAVQEKLRLRNSRN